MKAEALKVYFTPKLSVHGSVEQITQQATGKGPAQLDGAHAQPNSKSPSGGDGIHGGELIS